MFDNKFHPLPPEVIRILLPAFLYLLAVLIPSGLCAQSDLSLWGYVSDEETGLPVVGAKIELHPGGESVHTDQSGWFGFYYLKQPEIDIIVRADGYFEKSIDGIRLEGDKSNRRNVLLRKRLYYGDDQIVVAEKQTRVPGRIVITSDSPQFENARTLSEVLEYSPGIILASTGGGNQAATVSIGGAPAKQTGIYIDGIPLNSRLTGDFDINSIPKQAVEKIVIYTSGAGGELGVGSLSGAINIITRRAALEGEVSVNQSAGSFNSGATDVSIQNVFHSKFSGLFILSRNTSSNDFEYDDPKLGEVERENNYRDIGSRFVNCLYRLNDQDDISLTFSEFNSRAGLPGATYTLTYGARKSESYRKWSLTSDLSLGRKMKLMLSSQQLLSHQHFSDHDSFIPYESKYRDSRTGIFLKPYLMLAKDHHLAARLEFTFDRFRQENLLKDDSPAIKVKEDRIQSGLSYEGRISLGRMAVFFDNMNLNLALTNTASKLFRPLFSPSTRIGLEKGESQKLIVSLSYAGSYRAPTYGSLFWSEDAFSVGNPDLRPEKSEEFGLSGHLLLRMGGRWDLGVEYQHSFVKDLIYWERRFDGKFVPYNMAAARIETFRWSIDWDMALKPGKLSLVYSLSDPRDRSWESNHHDQLLTFYPRKMLDLGYELKPGLFFMSVHTRWISERFTVRANTTSLPAYTVTDLNAGIDIKIGKLRFNIRGDIDNLFSEEYQIIERYPLPRRSYAIRLGLTYNYNSGGSYGF
jgi:vitamin B12 transporter